MNLDQTAKIFICSYCEQQLKFRSDQEGKRIHCPKCKNIVWVFDNRTTSIASRLSSQWMFERSKLLGLLGSEMVGPISDIEFLGLVDRGELDRESIVQSPELTNNQELSAKQVNTALIRAMCNQREAESQRLQKVKARENQRDARNRETLRQGIKKAISDGSLSLRERTQLLDFASKVGIDAFEVEELLRSESVSLLEQVVEDSLSDGFFDDQENERLSSIAIGLGSTLAFTPAQQFRVSLARIASDLLQKLRSGNLPIDGDFKEAEVFEIVVLKRPSGIPLGDDHYLKSVGKGVIGRDGKNLLLDGRLTAKKYALTSMTDAKWYADGLFLKRSSGKSLFIRPEKFGVEWHQFAMSMEVLITGEPVIGVLPEENFIPATEFVVAEPKGNPSDGSDVSTDSETSTDDWGPSKRTPRFTFRVVGESIGNRPMDLNRLFIGEQVYFVRERQNPYDSNAISVTDREHRPLGYLKREVSQWFAPILDRGRVFQCVVKQRTSSGGIVVAVFD